MVAQLTTDFVEAVVRAIASASLDDLVEGDVAQRHYSRDDLVTVDDADAPTPSRRQGGSSRPPSSRPSSRANASSESNGAGSIAPSGIEDITNPDVLLAMFGGAGAKDTPSAPKSLPKILMAPASAQAPSGQSGHGQSGHAQSGHAQSGTASATSAPAETNGEGAAATAPVSSETPPTSRAVSSGPRLRPGEEIVRASASGGAVIRRRRV